MSTLHIGAFPPVAGTALFLLVASLVAPHARGGLPRPVADPRSIDGTGNNLGAWDWGAAGAPLLRISQTGSSTGAHYPDGGSGDVFRGGPGSAAIVANPRAVSNAVAGAPGSPPNALQMSGMVYQWGQFIDHDFTLVETNVAETSLIAVAGGDLLAPGIPFSRSVFAPGTGTSAANPRQQVNSLTAYIDASHVYGSNAVREAALRDSGGKLKTSAGALMPLNTFGLPNGSNPGQDPTQLFLAGDVRANEQFGLTAIHTLFVREHNRLVDLLAAGNPSWTGDQLYQTARKIVGAEMQVVTYNEFLPTVLGAAAPPAAAYNYDSTINAGVANEFATALFRFGHSLLPSHLPLASVGSHPAGDVALRDAFFVTDFFAGDATGATDRIAQLLKGISLQTAMQVDTMIVEDVRNFLFGPPGAGGMDLASLNIQRGRDHGLPGYNAVRAAYGLDSAATFADVTANSTLQSTLENLFGTPDDMDVWIGALAEDHLPGAAVGELIAAGLVDQFTRLRDGDRYFYLGDPELTDNPAIDAVIDLGSLTLSQLICWNTGMTDLPANVFLAVPEPATWLLAGLGIGLARVAQRRRSGR